MLVPQRIHGAAPVSANGALLWETLASKRNAGAPSWQSSRPDRRAATRLLSVRKRNLVEFTLRRAGGHSPAGLASALRVAFSSATPLEVRCAESARVARVPERLPRALRQRACPRSVPTAMADGTNELPQPLRRSVSAITADRTVAESRAGHGDIRLDLKRIPAPC